MSTFWYWFLDTEMRYYRDFETVDLGEGERIFREEDFRLWPDRNEAGDEEEEEEDRSSSSTPFSDESEPSDDEVQWYSA
jgi:hypothetical protein